MTASRRPKLMIFLSEQAMAGNLDRAEAHANSPGGKRHGSLQVWVRWREADTDHFKFW